MTFHSRVYPYLIFFFFLIRRVPDYVSKCLFSVYNNNITVLACTSLSPVSPLYIFSNNPNYNSKNYEQQENWAPPPDQPVQQRRRSHYVVEVSRRCSTSSDVPNRSQQQQQQQSSTQHCKQHNFTCRASQRSSSQGKYVPHVCVALSAALSRVHNGNNIIIYIIQPYYGCTHIYMFWCNTLYAYNNIYIAICEPIHLLLLYCAETRRLYIYICMYSIYAQQYRAITRLIILL